MFYCNEAFSGNTSEAKSKLGTSQCQYCFNINKNLLNESPINRMNYFLSRSPGISE